MPPDQLRNLQQVRRKSLSLNHRVGKGEDTELMDLLEDGDTQSPEAQMSETMLRQEIWDVLGDVLTEREKDIISLRYGLTSSKPCTLEEVGAYLICPVNGYARFKAKLCGNFVVPKLLSD